MANALTAGQGGKVIADAQRRPQTTPSVSLLAAAQPLAFSPVCRPNPAATTPNCPAPLCCLPYIYSERACCVCVVVVVCMARCRCRCWLLLLQ